MIDAKFKPFGRGSSDLNFIDLFFKIGVSLGNFGEKMQNSGAE